MASLHTALRSLIVTALLVLSSESAPAKDGLAGRPAGASAAACSPGICSSHTDRRCRFDRDCDWGRCVTPYAKRFVDNGDGTVSDLQTCLMWEKKTGDPGRAPPRHCGDPKADCSDPHHVSNRYPGITSIKIRREDGSYLLAESPSEPLAGAFLAKLNAPPGFAGYTDWRLPATEGDGTIQDGRERHLEANRQNADPELDSILWGCAGEDACLLPNANAYYWSSSITAAGGFPLCARTGRRIGTCNEFEEFPARAVRSIR